FCYALLDELVLTEGEFATHDCAPVAEKGQACDDAAVAYAAQSPWIFTGSVRDNILFGRPYEAAWYAEVVQACALDVDVATFPMDDQTRVGERGINLRYGGGHPRCELTRAPPAWL
ncbi:MAG TPA: hypothetical protein VMF89_35390, partial [Polyangiales bacterium]|nr:hypothetical protein [Polyangiales bacterium]